MWGSVVIPIRSGVTNTLVWFFIELVALWVIECALLRIHNHYVTKAIESGKKIQIQESKMPLVGTGLLAHGMQSKLFIFLRTALLVGFMLMNLGIDGTKQGIYETKTLHSQLELRSVADGNKLESEYDRPYAQMDNRVLIKCIKVSDDERRFTVFKPVFNLTKETTGASVSALIVKRDGSGCLDGISARENETFISGELLGDGLDDEPMKDGTKFRIKTDKYRLGIDILGAGDLVPITEISTMDRKPFNGNAKLVTGFCSPRQRSKVIGSEERGQAVNCLFIFEQRGLAVFSVKNSWVNNIWPLSNVSSVMILGTRASAIRMNLNVSLSKEVHIDIAQRLLIAEASFQVVPMIATILKYRYSATMDRKPFHIAAHVGDHLATDLSMHSVFIAGAVIVAAVALITLTVATGCWRRNGNAKIDLSVNTIDGLSKILAFEHINEGRCAAPDVLAEIGIYETGPDRLHVGPANKKACVPADVRPIEGKYPRGVSDAISRS